MPATHPPLRVRLCSHVERTLETFCNMNLEMQETQNIGKINKQVRGLGGIGGALIGNRRHCSGSRLSS